MFKTFQIDNLENFPKELEKLLENQKESIDKLLNQKEHNYQNIMKTLEDMDEERSLFFTPLSHLNSVLNSKETQKAYEESLPLLSRFHSEVSQNERLYKSIKELKAKNPEQKRVLDNEIRDFRLSGAELEMEQKQELEKIDLELSELSNQFSQNLLNATNEYELIIENFNDVAEIPKSDLNSAEFEENGKKKWRFTLQIPSYIAYMSYGSNRKYREELYRAYTTRASENAKVIDSILKLRQKKAKLLGFDNYAKYALESRDAKSELEVVDFLEKLVELSIPQAKKELEQLQNFAKENNSLNKLESYDLSYFSEKLKKELFDFDESDTKPYFEQGRVLNGLLELVSKLFQIEFKEIDTLIWHDSVRVFDIYQDDELSGRIYFDLEARKEKRGGAWMHDWESHFVDSKGELHLPSAFVVANFTPKSKNQPSLLRHDDVVTLFHEMGHALHHLLSRVDERSISGINGVAWDVVEFPSQFLENFAYEAPILRSFAYHYESGEAIPNELLEKIKDSKNFQASLGMLRQLEFALFDFKLHQKLYQGKEVQELLDEVREETSLLKPPSYNRFQHGFAHIFAGGYSAGYYSYKWAEVLSADAFFACLDKDGDFNRDMAQGYKNNILSKGASEDMSTLYQEWLGRKAQLESLIRLYDIKES